MRKIFFILVVLNLISCSSSDTDTSKFRSPAPIKEPVKDMFGNEYSVDDNGRVRINGQLGLSSQVAHCADKSRDCESMMGH